MDHPNARSLHATAIPRTGGLGLLAGILASWALLPLSPPLIIWLPVIVLASVSFADDVYDLPVWVRLLMHSVFAAWFSVAAHGSSDFYITNRWRAAGNFRQENLTASSRVSRVVRELLVKLPDVASASGSRDRWCCLPTRAV